MVVIFFTLTHGGSPGVDFGSSGVQIGVKQVQLGVLFQQGSKKLFCAVSFCDYGKCLDCAEQHDRAHVTHCSVCLWSQDAATLQQSNTTGLFRVLECLRKPCQDTEG